MKIERRGFFKSLGAAFGAIALGRVKDETYPEVFEKNSLPKAKKDIYAQYPISGYFTITGHAPSGLVDNLTKSL